MPTGSSCRIAWRPASTARRCQAAVGTSRRINSMSRIRRTVSRRPRSRSSHMRIRSLILLCALAAAVWSQTRNSGPALEGNDPVLLTEGKDVEGLESLTVQHGRFLYRFASAETRDRFNKDPERYSIQLDGACARMGPPVTGDQNAYLVYNGRIYIMGSQEC